MHARTHTSTRAYANARTDVHSMHVLYVWFPILAETKQSQPIVFALFHARKDDELR